MGVPRVMTPRIVAHVSATSTATTQQCAPCHAFTMRLFNNIVNRSGDIGNVSFAMNPDVAIDRSTVC